MATGGQSLPVTPSPHTTKRWQPCSSFLQICFIAGWRVCFIAPVTCSTSSGWFRSHSCLRWWLTQISIEFIRKHGHYGATVQWHVPLYFIVFGGVEVRVMSRFFTIKFIQTFLYEPCSHAGPEKTFCQTVLISGIELFKTDSAGANESSPSQTD